MIKNGDYFAYVKFRRDRYIILVAHCNQFLTRARFNKPLWKLVFHLHQILRQQLRLLETIAALPIGLKIAPAAIKSSNAGRKLPSGHLSPQAITDTTPSLCLAKLATADTFLKTFLKHPATTVAFDSLARNEHVAPFGEGSTIRLPNGIVESSYGESEIGSPRLPATIALT
ncbi:hypothetical protein D478_26669 [Brevibacillus agri BAB-2500]|nr:hypothetical protein D478_26669 [Brevibacillus agri BAB-2500]